MPELSFSSQFAKAGLSVLERMANTPRLSRNLITPHISIVLVGWDSERTRRGVKEIARWLDHYSINNADWVVVTNQAAAKKGLMNIPNLNIIDGSNSDGEFSGYDEGIEYLGHSVVGPHVWVLLNDRFLSYERSDLTALSPDVISYAYDHSLVVGRVVPFPEPYKVVGQRMDYFCQSNLMAIPANFFEDDRVATTIRHSELDELWLSNSDDLTLDLRDTDPGYCNFTYEWLTGDGDSLPTHWYQAEPLTVDNLQTFRRKVQSILNEHLLSARLLEQGLGLATLDQTRLVSQLHAIDPDSAAAQSLGIPEAAIKFVYGSRARMRLSLQELRVRVRRQLKKLQHLVTPEAGR